MQFYKGMDVSMQKELEQHGALYCINNTRKDLFTIFKETDVNLIRLRLWNNPYDEEGNPYGGGMNNLETTIELAKRIIANNLNIMLDFHYSDFWADPSKQKKPKDWENLNGEELENMVYTYTKETLSTLKSLNIEPSVIQIGNEITNGLLWPDGKIDNIEGMAKLLNAGIKGAKEICSNAEIVLHLDYGTNNEMYRKWFSDIEPYKLDYDIIGMSFYPYWNGTIDELKRNMNDISKTFNKDILIAETAIGYTTDSLGCSGLVFSEEQEAATGYKATPEGQETFLRDLYTAVREVENGHGRGVVYWEPSWLPIPDCIWAQPQGSLYMNDNVAAGNSMANQALFDKEGNTNQALLNLYKM